jgi:hypothetical protein
MRCVHLAGPLPAALSRLLQWAQGTLKVNLKVYLGVPRLHSERTACVLAVQKRPDEMSRLPADMVPRDVMGRKP